LIQVEWDNKAMSDTPKFEVIDRRKIKAEEEKEQAPSSPVQEEKPSAPQAGPRLVVPEEKAEHLAEDLSAEVAAEEHFPDLPPAPTPEESKQQKTAYDASAQRLEDLVRAQNPAMGAQPPVGFDHLVQQLYLSAMIQMGAGTQEGQRPRIDILGARQTVDLLGVLAEKTKGNLTDAEDRTLQTVLFEVRMAFLELTNMITLQGVPAPPPPGKR
jgi:Domain of unknown function (DUF1844)